MKLLITLVLITSLSSFCYPLESESSFSEVGIASYYSDYYQGKLTANGEIFNQGKMTAAHKSLPFGSVVIVENLRNNQKVKVIINDRGPFIEGRIIDLSYAAAVQMDMVVTGIDKVRIEVITAQ